MTRLSERKVYFFCSKACLNIPKPLGVTAPLSNLHEVVFLWAKKFYRSRSLFAGSLEHLCDRNLGEEKPKFDCSSPTQFPNARSRSWIGAIATVMEMWICQLSLCLWLNTHYVPLLYEHAYISHWITELPHVPDRRSFFQNWIGILPWTQS